MKLRMVGWALIRRWYAAVAGLLAVGAACLLVYGAVPADYKANGSLVLLPSPQSVGAAGNPYLFLGGLGQAMDVLTRRMTAPDTTGRYAATYPKMSYTALPDVTSGSSILVVTVTARSSEDAGSALQKILADVPAELTSMQDALHVPAASRISSMPVAQPSAPTVDVKRRIQATGGVGAAGVVLVILLTALLDGLLLRRSRRLEADRWRAKAHHTAAPEHDEESSPYLVSVYAGETGEDGEREPGVEASGRAAHRSPSRSAR
ncbi:hypothetical protein [Sinomonas susongensis]|uniref:hypothetical protein n=1 Tax=Sinomonas susongensis TaxID=1324851 RepID=UPI001108A9FD|nr:hypothetical protein [Sinomonas susongensis]